MATVTLELSQCERPRERSSDVQLTNLFYYSSVPRISDSPSRSHDFRDLVGQSRGEPDVTARARVGL